MSGKPQQGEKRQKNATKNQGKTSFTTNLRGAKRKEFDEFFIYFLEFMEKQNPTFELISRKVFYKKHYQILKPLTAIFIGIVVSYDVWVYFEYINNPMTIDTFKIIILNLLAIASSQFLFYKPN